METNNNNIILIGNPTIGADIEMFLMDKTTRRLVSAEGYIRGTKHEPFNFDVSNPFFAISLDNVSAEFCIPPVTNAVDWLENIKKSVGYINGSIPDTLISVAEPAAIFDDEFLQTENAKMFGCESDYDVWKRMPNIKPNAENANLRSCGGHIHVGFTKPSEVVMEAMGINAFIVDEYVIKAMDLFVGVPSVLQEPDNQRKNLYGKAGAFRFKDYGVEYRTVSNYYLQSDALTKWAFDNTMKAIEFVNDGRMPELEAVADTVQHCINTADKNMAGNIIRQFELPLV